MFRAPRLSLILAAAVLSLAGGCGSNEPDASPRDLVIIVLDALPATGLSSYGYQRETTPVIDAIAASAIRFEQAHSSASYTLASTASLFTGMTPRAHGCVDEVGQVLGPDRATLAEHLAERGFATAAFSLNPQVSRETGFDQGFDVFEYEPRDDFTYNRLPAGFIERVAKTWHKDAGKRRFMYVHLLPPHVPYNAPPPFDTNFGADEIEHSEGGQTDLRALNHDTAWLTADDQRVRRARRLYDAGLTYGDAMVGELLDALGRDAGMDGAALVIISDHGEAFGEHGRILHGSMASKEMVHVPLIIDAPGIDGEVRGDTVRTRDLAATLAELLDVSWNQRVATGRSFLHAPGLAKDDAKGALSRSVGSAPIWALRTETWTLMRHMATGREELFDRKSDPLELHDLATSKPQDLARMKKALDRALGRERGIGQRFAAPKHTDAHADALHDIGYGGVDEDHSE